MNVIMWTDMWILGKCQRFSDWLTKTFGIANANMKVAYGFLTLTAFIWVGMGFILNPADVDKNIKDGVSGLFLAVMWFLLFYLPKQNGNGSARKSPQIYLFLRLACWAILLTNCLGKVLPKIIMNESPNGEDVCVVIVNFSTLLFAYFVSCSGLPRQKGRVFAWLSSFVTKREFAADETG